MGAHKDTRPMNLLTLREVLAAAEDDGYAVGSFSCRYTPMIRPILHAAQEARSPAIVQISQKELSRYGSTPGEVAREFYTALVEEGITVPVVLHLDHTKDIAVIEDAIAAGFTSVMIDASDYPLDDNIVTTRRVTAYAHPRAISVEAELGRIGTTDFVETASDEEMYTKPDEAGRFVRETTVDALAVSVGTAHGVYTVRQPTIDLARLAAIRAQTAVALVLHGGSGVPATLMRQAITLPGGGVSKVNIATDLELAVLAALNRTERMSNAECRALPPAELRRAQQAVASVVTEKMTDYLMSAKRVGEGQRVDR